MFNALAAEIHQSNIDAGWWKLQKDDSSPEGISTIPRNIGELLCLVHSEIDEGFEGFAHNLQDDKLPHLPMFDVEMADTCIRVFDILGWKKADIDSIIGTMAPPPNECMSEITLFLLLAHGAVSQAMEGYRKSNDEDGNQALIALLRLLIDHADYNNCDLFSIIAEKRAFNANRPDHKLEARAAADGKKF